MDVTFRTHVGRVRKINEDSVLVRNRLFVVADGMGGHQAGEVASDLAVRTLAAVCQKRADLGVLEKAVLQANGAILLRAQGSDACKGMGTTLTALWAGKQRVFIAHVGDSRAYRLRSGVFTQLTQDHSIVAELMRKGILTPEEARSHPYRNVITRALGTNATVEVDMLELDRRKGDMYLICSDGLTGMVEEAKILTCLQTMTLNQAADELLDSALKAGGTDNISFILIKDDGRMRE